MSKYSSLLSDDDLESSEGTGWQGVGWVGVFLLLATVFIGLVIIRVGEISDQVCKRVSETSSPYRQVR